MIITFIGVGAVSTSGTVAVPSGYQDGDLFVIVCTGDTTNYTTPSGWSKATGNSNTSFPVTNTFYKFASGVQSSVALTGGGTSKKAVLLCYRNVNGLDAAASNTGTSTSVTALGTTVNFIGDLGLIVFTQATTGVAATFSVTLTGYNTRVNSSATTTVCALAVVDQLQSSSSSFVSVTSTVSAAFACNSSSFTPSSSGAFFLNMMED